MAPRIRQAAAFAALVVVALVLTAQAVAATVTVRVEGRTQTLFGPRPVTVDASTALAALEAASLRGEFFYELTSTSFGDYVSRIGRYAGEGSAGWVFKVNGASPPVGADQVQLRDGDEVLWYWATFGAAGGPPTLDLRAAGAGCYSVWAVDDAGVRRRAEGAVLHVDGRRVRATAGRGCVGKHRGLVRAYAVGAVRSNALR